MKPSDLFRKILKRPEDSGGGSYAPPTHSETFQRSAKEEFLFEDWKARKEYRPYLEQISESYQKRKEQEEGPVNLFIFESPASNGFYFSYDPKQFDPRDFRHLFDYFKEKVLALDYTLKNAQRSFDERKDHVKITERYYLKPATNREQTDPPIDQKFGNLELQHVSINHSPSYVKLMANVYNDRNYAAPRAHEQLIDHLFS